jgi:SagB-type dehydrogenase family enzyme
VSRDDGSTRALTDAEVAAIWAIALSQPIAEHAMPSAAARAALGEAREAYPRETDIRVADHLPSPPAAEIALAKHARELTTPYQAVLDSRRSRRALEPLSLEDLATLLCAAGRITDFSDSDDGFQKTSRPTPSAGGRHPCGLVVATSRVEEVKPALWCFDALRCSLVQIPSPPTLELALGKAAAAATLLAPAPATVFVVGEITRTLSRYPAGATLAWRDAGTALATLHLTATAASLNSCIVGTSGVLFYDEALMRADLGALLVGRAPGHRAIHERVGDEASLPQFPERGSTLCRPH